jgi:hypothetical protein
MLMAVSLVMGLLIVWAAVTVVFFLIWIYQTMVGLHEDEQLFIDESEAHLAKEQTEVFQQMDRLRPYFLGSLVASVVLGVTTFGAWVFQQLSQ